MFIYWKRTSLEVHLYHHYLFSYCCWIGIIIACCSVFNRVLSLRRLNVRIQVLSNWVVIFRFVRIICALRAYVHIQLAGSPRFLCVPLHLYPESASMCRYICTFCFCYSVDTFVSPTHLPLPPGAQSALRIAHGPRNPQWARTSRIAIDWGQCTSPFWPRTSITSLAKNHDI